jgi:hypothetical protein
MDEAMVLEDWTGVPTGLTLKSSASTELETAQLPAG